VSDDELTNLCAFDGDATDIAGIVQDPDSRAHRVGLLGPDEGGWALTPDQADALADQLREYAREARELDRGEHLDPRRKAN
jgi:hypothetical protein